MRISTRLPLLAVIFCLEITFFINNRCDALRLPTVVRAGTGISVASEDKDVDTDLLDSVQTADCFKLLARFSFLSGGNSFDNVKYQFNYRNETNRNLYLAVYSDKNADMVQTFTPPGTHCFDKLQKARESALRVVNVYDRAHSTNACPDGTNTLRGSLRIDYGGFSYFALIHVNPSRCNSSADVGCQGPLLDVNYSLHLTNSAENAKVFHQEISSDELGFAYFSMGLTFAAAVNFMIAMIAGCKLSKAYKYHYIPKGLMFASVCLLISSILWATHYYIYSVSGRPSTYQYLQGGGVVRSFLPLRFFAQFFWMMSDEALVACMLCLAKGWTLVRKKMTPRSRGMYGTLLTVYVFIGWTSLIWASLGTTVANSISLWDTVPGLIFLLCRLMIFGFFLWAYRTTLVKKNAKKGFFCKFALACSLWFVAMPLIALFSISGGLRPQSIFSFLQITNYSCIWLALLMLNIMYWPGPKISRGFPFHSFHLPSKEKIKKLKKKQQEAKEKLMANMTEDERAELMKQEEEIRLRELDPLSRFGEYLKRYEKEVQACIDFSNELKISLREIDDLNAEADKIEAEWSRSNDSRGRRGDDRQSDNRRRGDDDGDRGSRRSRAREPDDANDDNAPAEGRRRQRRPRRGREPRGDDNAN